MPPESEHEPLLCRWCAQAHAPAALSPGEGAYCRRCEAPLDVRRNASLHKTLAYSTAALLLFLPANIFPILTLHMYGATTESTVWQGCVRLYESGDAAIAVVVFLASMVVPLLKLAGLFFVSLTSAARSTRGRRLRTRVFRFIESIGKWAMLDVFVLAIIVSLVRLQRLASAKPGVGALAFVGVVVFTLLASRSFDPRLIWEDYEE